MIPDLLSGLGAGREIPDYQRDLIDFLKAGKRTGALRRILATRRFTPAECGRLRAIAERSIEKKKTTPNKPRRRPR